MKNKTGLCGSGFSIDHKGHLWGAISGAALTILMDPGVVGRFVGSLSGGG